MPANPNAERFVQALETYRSPEQREKYQRYFKLDEGQYGEGDVFIGVRMGQVFALAKEFIDMPPEDIEKLLESPIHEVRAGATSIMDKQGRSKKTTESRRKALFDLYLRRTDRINNWDLVDLAAPYVVARYLSDNPNGRVPDYSDDVPPIAVVPEWCQKRLAQTPEHPLLPRIWHTYAESERVTDGTRTRALRSHNPPTPVATGCRALQKRLI